MLSDRLIRHGIHTSQLDIWPWRDEQLQGASYDVTLHPQLLALRSSKTPIDTKTDMAAEWFTISMRSEGYLLTHGQFVLGSTLERIQLSAKLVGQLEGKSSLGRLGLLVHSTAGYLDPGFGGQVTLELSCVHQRGIMLYPGMPIGQVAFSYVPGGVDSPYAGKYMEQEGPTASKYHQNWDGQRWR